MRYVVLILGLALAACSNGDPEFGQFGQQTVPPQPFQITFPTEGGIAGTQPQVRWTEVPGVTTYELSVWGDASLRNLVDFQRVTDTEATVRIPLQAGSMAYAEVRTRSGFQILTTGIVAFTVAGVPQLLGPTEGNRLASLAAEGGAALALLDMAGNATWLHVHSGPGSILDARVLPHGVVYLTETTAHEVGWDGMPLWEGPAGAFVDGPGTTTLVDMAGMELGSWPSQGAGTPVEATAPVAVGGALFDVLWAVSTNG